ncbi:MAG TPA: DUF1801 domain-containing protein [Candidatus Limnocylindria bacterium]|nr:DUF1801 domain-containing protein [Candidatus Limnocylindria bacterium]
MTSSSTSSQTVEVVWPKQGSVGWGIGPKKVSEQFCYLLPCKRHVTLGFYYGGELPDSAGLLGGGGRQVSGKLSMRSLKLAGLQDVRRSELRQLVEAAVAHLARVSDLEELRRVAAAVSRRADDRGRGSTAAAGSAPG